ncbi:hypothetical protein KQX54_005269 [Cotesia glomerata]|uniref:Uncharacterized protein n=1 Tax=Cotesia glomerata TaxID=32391 RepID=A0AAV7HX08_COTGL|nr:hypothetical protein KQX54_005269 [Cotesia glomerata]
MVTECIVLSKRAPGLSREKTSGTATDNAILKIRACAWHRQRHLWGERGTELEVVRGESCWGYNVYKGRMMGLWKPTCSGIGWAVSSTEGNFDSCYEDDFK